MKSKEKFNPKPFRNTFIYTSPTQSITPKKYKSKERPPLQKQKTMDIPEEFTMKENKFKKYFEKPYKIPGKHMFQAP